MNTQLGSLHVSRRHVLEAIGAGMVATAGLIAWIGVTGSHTHTVGSQSQIPSVQGLQQFLASNPSLSADKVARIENEIRSIEKYAQSHPMTVVPNKAESQQEAAASMANAPTPTYNFGITQGNNPPGMLFDASQDEWLTNFNGSVYQVFGGVETTPGGTPTVAAVVVERNTPNGPVVVGTYPLPAAGSSMLQPDSYSGSVLTLVYGANQSVRFNLAILSFES